MVIVVVPALTPILRGGGWGVGWKEVGHLYSRGEYIIFISTLSIIVITVKS